MPSEFDPDSRVVKSDQGAIINQGGNVTTRLPGRRTLTGTPLPAQQGGVPGSVTVADLQGRVQAGATDVQERRTDGSGSIRDFEDAGGGR